MEKLKTFLSAAFVMCLLLGNSVMAARNTITLPEHQEWVSLTTSRYTAYHTLSARCIAVYPMNGGTDEFKIIQAQITDRNGAVVINTFQLDETTGKAETFAIPSAYQHEAVFVFKFRGNNYFYSAYADVTYEAN